MASVHKTKEALRWAVIDIQKIVYSHQARSVAARCWVNRGSQMKRSTVIRVWISHNSTITVSTPSRPQRAFSAIFHQLYVSLRVNVASSCIVEWAKVDYLEAFNGSIEMTILQPRILAVTLERCNNLSESESHSRPTASLSTSSATRVQRCGRLMKERQKIRPLGSLSSRANLKKPIKMQVSRKWWTYGLSPRR